MKKNYKRAVLVCNARQFVQSQRELAAAHQPTLISAASLALPIIQDGTTVSASTTCLPQQPPLLKHKSDIVSPSKSPGKHFSLLLNCLLLSCSLMKVRPLKRMLRLM